MSLFKYIINYFLYSSLIAQLENIYIIFELYAIVKHLKKKEPARQPSDYLTGIAWLIISIENLQAYEICENRKY